MLTYASVIICLLSTISRAQTSNKHYVISRTYREPNAQITWPNSSIDWGNSHQAVSQISYSDELGKQKKLICVYDCNQATEYLLQQMDYVHRPVKCYLPVAVTLSTVGEQVTLSYSFCNSGDVLKSPHRGANYFTKTAYEQSPLSRTAQVKATALHDDSSGMQTFSKAIDNAIKRYPVGSNSQAIPSSNYAGGELQCTNVMGECYSFQW